MLSGSVGQGRDQMEKTFRVLRSDNVVEIYRQSEANARIYARTVLEGYRKPGCTYLLERVIDGEWRPVGLI